MAKANDVLKVAKSQIGVKESPKNSNKTKYGKEFGANGVPWCAIFLWWCFKHAKAGSLFPHNSNAAYAQDEVVSKCGGSWVMKKNTSRATRKAYLSKAKPGDIVCFDFGNMSAYRQHIGIVESVSGNYLICIEGNTSKTGSQSNGGMVVRQRRIYTSVCSAARPKWTETIPKVTKPTGKYSGVIPQPKLREGDKGTEVKNLQKFLNWYTKSKLAVDGEFGPSTLYQTQIFQATEGIKPPGGVYGVKSHKAASKYQGSKPKPKTKAELIVDMAKKCAWAFGTKKSVYTYPSGKPKPDYKTALQKAYGDRKEWSAQTKAGASCDVFAGTVIRASGADKAFPRGLGQQIPYIKKSSKWTKIAPKKKADLKAGDIIIWQKSNGTGHICVYIGDGRVCEAGYKTKRYGCTVTAKSAYYTPSEYKKYKFFGVYRKNDK